MATLAGSPTPSIDELLAWPDDELARIDHLMAQRRFWMGPLYRKMRAEYDEAAGATGATVGSMDEARAIVDTLPSTPYFLWLDRHIQDTLWTEVEGMVQRRSEAIEASLTPRDDDLGTLTEDPDLVAPGYYSGTDFHRQTGGIWPDARGAAVYAMGARAIHVGRNNNFELHDAFAGSLPTERPTRVVDLACGYGKTTFSLKKRWPEAEVHGLDLAAPCLRLARRMATERGLEIHWRQGDAEHPPYDDASFDLVVVTMALHELPRESIFIVLREAHRLLRPGATFAALENRLIGDPLRDVLGAYHSDVIVEPYMNPFRGSEFAEYANAAGFTTEVTNWYPPGAVAGSEYDPQQWSSPWSLLVARKDV